MNELLFFIQIAAMFLFAYKALRLGSGALIAFVSIQAILANFFVLKQMHFFGFEVTCSDAFAVGGVLGLNLLREYFGQKEAKKAIWISFFFMLFFVVFSKLHLLFTPSVHDTTQLAYLQLLSPAPRILLASLAVFFIVQQFDMRLFNMLSRSTIPFYLRNGISLTLSQLLDTLLFSFLGLYGLVANITHIILISFLIKLLIIFALTPLISRVKKQAHG